MDFEDTPEEATFRAEVRAFLDANTTRKSTERAYRKRALDEADVARAKQWQAKKADAGFAAITWPTEYGGRGGSMIQHLIYAQEEESYVVPQHIFNQSIGLALPTIMTHGRKDQVERFARPALRGEEIWCQLFSEPAAGSDLGGLRTRAVRDGDEWVINGQKIWTSNAYFADFGMLVARSDANVAKHAGLTFFYIDMKSPGIEIRRIRQISGASNFCEVFFTDVRIPDSQRLGAVGEGWKVAMTMLLNERLVVGQAEGPDFEDIYALAKLVLLEGAPAIEDVAVRERLADWYIQQQGLRLTKFRTMTALSRGKTPGPEASITKLVSATKLQDIASFGIDLLGMAGAAMDPRIAPMNAWFQEALLYAPGKRIAGGTDEVLRNIIAERVLKLPGDMRADKDLPFRDIPTGAKS
jgi:alkylation response protein AidB-like acyl-CoA dehydrogenase